MPDSAGQNCTRFNVGHRHSACPAGGPTAELMRTSRNTVPGLSVKTRQRVVAEMNFASRREKSAAPPLFIWSDFLGDFE